MLQVKRKDETFNLQTGDIKDGTTVFNDIWAQVKSFFHDDPRPLDDAVIEGGIFDTGAVVYDFKNVQFKNCTFRRFNFSFSTFENCQAIECIFDECEEYDTGALEIINPKEPVYPSNDTLAKQLRGTVTSLPHPKFAKVSCECDFCHRKFEQIVNRVHAKPWLKPVPNCGKQVCESCNKFYSLRDKFVEGRSYGYHGPLSFYRTPMDKRNTAILGLEMEFEGDYYGWKELQDAHQGKLFYGFDSSVEGQNELSWDCGSYSWWKYLSPLKAVCEVLKKYGGREGPTAGVHIHVSRPDVIVREVTRRINQAGNTGAFKALLEAISLRSDRDKFEQYANLEIGPGNHHAGISYNSHDTCEFRVFACSLDHKLLLKRLLLCKTIFNSFADGNDAEYTMREAIPDFLKKFIMECADIQLDKGFISKIAHNKLKNALNKEVKTCA